EYGKDAVHGILCDEFGPSCSHSAIRSNDAVLAELLTYGKQKLADNGGFPSVLGSSAKLVRNQQALCLEEVAARLLECTFERPDPAVHHSVTQQLSQLSQWLSSGDAQSAAQLLLKAGAAVAQVEHMLRSTGQVVFWTPDVVAAAVALLRMYCILGRLAVRSSSAALLQATARLALGRPELFDLVHQLLHLHHFTPAYSELCSQPAGTSQAAAELWQVLFELVRLAVAAVQQLSSMQAKPGCSPQQQPSGSGPLSSPLGNQLVPEWVPSLMTAATSLLAPGAGVCWRLLGLPLSRASVVGQLGALRVLKNLYQLPGTSLLEAKAVADAWCDLHWSHFTFYYTAAGHRASSAAAELASLHLSLLLPLAANGAPAVRAALLRLGAAAFLLREFSLEAQLLSAEQLQAELAASEAQTAITCGSDSDIETSSSSSNGNGCSSMDEEQPAGEAGLAAVVEAASGQLATAAARGGVSREMRAGSAVMLQDTATRFFFTGDLNEDLDRLLALEDATGQEITLDGLGYDDEAKQLMARFDQDKQAAAATAAALDKTIAAIAVLSGASLDSSDQPAAASAQPAPTQPSPRAAPLTLPSRPPTASSTAHTPQDLYPGTPSGSQGTPSATPSHAHSPLLLSPRSVAGASTQLEHAYPLSSPFMHARASSSGQEPSLQDSSQRPCAPPVPVPKLSLQSLHSAASSRIFSPSLTYSQRGTRALHSYRPRDPGSSSRDASARLRAPLPPKGPGTGPHPSPRPLTLSPAPSLPYSPMRSTRTTRVTRPTAHVAFEPPSTILHHPPPSTTSQLDTAQSANSFQPASAAGPLPPSLLQPAGRMSPTACNPMQGAPQGGAAAWTLKLQQAQCGRAAHSVSHVSSTCPNPGDACSGSACTPSHLSPRPRPRQPLLPLARLSQKEHGVPALNLRGLLPFPPSSRDQSSRAANQPAVCGTPTGPSAASSGCSLHSNSAVPDSAMSWCTRGRPAQPLTGAAGVAARAVPAVAAGSTDCLAYLAPHTSAALNGTGGNSCPAASGAAAQPAGSRQRSASCLSHEQQGREQGPTSETEGPASRSVSQIHSPAQPQPLHTDSTPAATNSAAPEQPCSPLPSPSLPRALSYRQTMLSKLWYHDRDLHVQLLLLLLQLVLSPQGGLDPATLVALDAGRCSQTPLHDSHRGSSMNIEHVLAWHFTGPPGSSILPELVKAALVLPGREPGCMSPPQPGYATSAPLAAPQAQAASLRLLRLLARQLLDTSRYSDLVFHTRGARGAIYRARQAIKAGAAPQQLQYRPVMIKVVELPQSGFDASKLPEVYGEVSILERFAQSCAGAHTTGLGPDACRPSTPDCSAQPVGQPLDVPKAAGGLEGGGSHGGVCQLLDYGLSNDAYWIVLHRYRCNLSEWRARQPHGPPTSPAATALYLAVLLKVLAALERLASAAVVHFDLKAANVLVHPHSGVRDSELWDPQPIAPYHPPFDVVLADFGEARAYQTTKEAFTARNRGQTLFAHADYASITHRVAFGGGTHLQLSPMEKGVLGALPHEVNTTHGIGNELVALIEWILARDVTKRPSLEDIKHRLESLHSDLTGFALLHQLLHLHHLTPAYSELCSKPAGTSQAAAELWQVLFELVRLAVAAVQKLSSMQAKPGCSPQQQPYGSGLFSSPPGNQLVPEWVPSLMAAATSLLAPGAGVCWRLLGLPLSRASVVGQLGALRVLKNLYQLPGTSLLEAKVGGSCSTAAVADAWCDLHWSHFTFYYTAAGHQASSAAAELASLHLSLLLPLAANGAPAVRAALLRLGAAAFLLREFSLEAQLLSAEQLQAELAASEAQTAITCGSDSDIETSSSSSNSNGCSSMDEEQLAEEAGLAAVVEAASGQLATAAARGGVSREMRAGSAVMLQDTATRFFFTGDLNEDLDRLLALEDATGAQFALLQSAQHGWSHMHHSVVQLRCGPPFCCPACTGQEITLDGLGYDDEAKQLMARFDQDKQAAAATAAALDKTIVAIAVLSGASLDSSDQPAAASAQPEPTQPSPRVAPLTLPSRSPTASSTAHTPQDLYPGTPPGSQGTPSATPSHAHSPLLLSPLACIYEFFRAHALQLLHPRSVAGASTQPEHAYPLSSPFMHARASSSGQEPSLQDSSQRPCAPPVPVPKLYLQSLRSAASSRIFSPSLTYSQRGTIALPRYKPRDPGSSSRDANARLRAPLRPKGPGTGPHPSPRPLTLSPAPSLPYSPMRSTRTTRVTRPTAHVAFEPVTMATNPLISSNQTPILDDDNWPIWSIRLTGLLIEAGLWSIVVDGVTPYPPPRFRGDKALDRKARAFIQRHVSNLPTSQFTQSSVARHLQLQQQLSLLRMESGEAVARFFARLQ
ncbi:hypothetical protein QJQ45_020267, partial [Haematococcus lacustris]